MKNINSTLLDKLRTSIFIAHRLRTVVEAGTLVNIAFKGPRANTAFSLKDLIIVMKDGQVVEQGTHEELLKLGGLYFSMWQQQASLERFREDLPSDLSA